MTWFNSPQENLFIYCWGMLILNRPKFPNLYGALIFSGMRFWYRLKADFLGFIAFVRNFSIGLNRS